MASGFYPSEARIGQFLDRWTDGQMFGKVPFVCACVRVRARAGAGANGYFSVFICPICRQICKKYNLTGKKLEKR